MRKISGQPPAIQEARTCRIEFLAVGTLDLLMGPLIYQGYSGDFTA